MLYLEITDTGTCKDKVIGREITMTRLTIITRLTVNCYFR